MLSAYHDNSGFVALSALKNTIFAMSFIEGLGLQFAGDMLNWGLGQIDANQQYQRQLEFWNKQNAYNSPSAQRQRWAHAGFNPVAVTGQMANNSQAQGLSSISGNPAAGNAFNTSALAQNLKAFEEIENIALNSELASSELALNSIEQVLKIMNIPDKFIDLYMKRVRANRYPEIVDNEVALGDSEITLKDSQRDLNESHKDLNEALKETENMLREARKKNIEANTREADASANLKGEEKDIKVIEKKYADEFFDQRVENLKKDLHVKQTQMLLNMAEKMAANALAGKYSEETDYIDTLELSAWNDEQRKAALHPYELVISQAAADKGLTDAETAKILNEFNEVVLRKGVKLSDIPTLIKKWIMDNTSFSTSVNLALHGKL